MNPNSYNFIKAVLGEDGATAIRKATAKFPTFEHAVLPRTILGWLEIGPQFSYEGEIPGVENTYLAFQKTEAGFTGRIKLGGTDYPFERATVFQVAAGIAVALDAEPEQLASSVRNVDIARLGKSIDLLAKAKVAADSLAKGDKKLYCTACKDPLDKNGHCKVKSHWAELDKAQGQEPKGTAAKPIAPTPPAPQVRSQPGQVAPSAPTSARASKPAIKSELRVTKAEADRRCGRCRQPQFKGASFRGCLCFMALSKGVTVVPNTAGYTLRFSPAWDREAVAAITELFKGR